MDIDIQWLLGGVGTGIATGAGLAYRHLSQQIAAERAERAQLVKDCAAEKAQFVKDCAAEKAHLTALLDQRDQFIQALVIRKKDRTA